jgi:hypothetical protein
VCAVEHTSLARRTRSVRHMRVLHAFRSGAALTHSHAHVSSQQRCCITSTLPTVQRCSLPTCSRAQTPCRLTCNPYHWVCFSPAATHSMRLRHVSQPLATCSMHSSARQWVVWKHLEAPRNTNTTTSHNPMCHTKSSPLVQGSAESCSEQNSIHTTLLRPGTTHAMAQLEPC